MAICVFMGGYVSISWLGIVTFCFLPSLLHTFHLRPWLTSGTALQRQPAMSEASLSFLIRFHITARTKSLTTRCDSGLFIPRNPVRPECFLPLPFPLAVVGSVPAHIKVNGPQQHTVSQHGDPILAFKWPVGGPELFLQQ